MQSYPQLLSPSITYAFLITLLVQLNPTSTRLSDIVSTGTSSSWLVQLCAILLCDSPFFWLAAAFGYPGHLLLLLDVMAATEVSRKCSG